MSHAILGGDDFNFGKVQILAEMLIVAVENIRKNITDQNLFTVYSNEILGGYNPIIWKSDCCFGTTKDSFIFSFKDKDSIGNCILSRIEDEELAIYNHPDYGPSFETEDDFFVEEYEIFQIIIKN
ncbi:hypothetical protein C1645_835329 [Glomus cerebriforme]|uniref:TLDc domain-containing protein n=1 Tax=Glomus cerebriforme TaxID=658196 RepID=A0A397SI29_9GLOM|nr:hypothetical protein C1645_835329 [Glomus cerebriforme]